MEKLAAGEEIDWAAVWKFYYTKIYAYVYRRTSDSYLAEDLAAQVFLKAMEATRAGKGWTYHFGGWLYRIAHNLVIDHYRAMARQKHTSLDAVAWLEDLDGSPYGYATNQMLDAAVRRHLRHLTEGQRIAVAMELDDYHTAETAEFLDTTEGAAKGLLHRGRVTMLILLADEFEAKS